MKVKGSKLAVNINRKAGIERKRREPTLREREI